MHFAHAGCQVSVFTCKNSKESHFIFYKNKKSPFKKNIYLTTLPTRGRSRALPLFVLQACGKRLHWEMMCLFDEGCCLIVS